MNRSVQFHLKAYTGHVRQGLTRITKGFNGGNLREPKLSSEFVKKGDKQTKRIEMNRQTDS